MNDDPRPRPDAEPLIRSLNYDQATKGPGNDTGGGDAEFTVARSQLAEALVRTAFQRGCRSTEQL